MFNQLINTVAAQPLRCGVLHHAALRIMEEAMISRAEP